MKFFFNTADTEFTIIIPSGFPRIAAATTIGNVIRFRAGFCPDAASIAHEFYHVRKTSWKRYLLSATIGKLWGDKYAHTQEVKANIFAKNTAPAFEDVFLMLRRELPANWPTANFSNSAR